jgi:hypothetical protein
MPFPDELINISQFCPDEPGAFNNFSLVKPGELCMSVAYIYHYIHGIGLSDMLVKFTE